MSQAKKGDNVKIHYKGTLEDGTVFDSSEGHDPLGFKIGAGEVIVGFEEAVTGMTVGEKKNVTIPADKAYGQPQKEMIIQAPINQIPADLNPEIGQKLELGGPNGELMAVKVVELTDEYITLDANPPLAGKDLTFDIELMTLN